MKLIEINGVHYDIFHCRRGYALQTDSCEIKANSALRSMDDFNQKNWCSHFLSSHWCSVFLFLFLFILLFFGPIYISPIFCVFRRFFVCFVNFQYILSIFGVNPRFQSKQSSCYLSVVQSGCHHNVICIERTIYIKVLDQLMYLHVPQEHAVGPIFCVNQVVSVRLFDIANFKWKRRKNHHRNKIYLPFILYDASVSVNFSIPGRMIAINQTNKCVFVISIFRRVLTIWKTVTSCVANRKVRCSAETFILIWWITKKVPTSFSACRTVLRKIHFEYCWILNWVRNNETVRIAIFGWIDFFSEIHHALQSIRLNHLI